MKWYNILFFLLFLSLFMISRDYISDSGTGQHEFIPSEAVEVTKDQDSLMKQIQESASDFQVKPENAYIDRVWKKTPGRFGRVVNVEESYGQMKENKKFSKKKLVFDEVRPKQILKELPPAPIYRGHPNKQAVALMINVSWGTEYIPTILDILAKTNVKATFFIDGSWANKNKDVLQMIHEEGHLIGNHAYSHPNMRYLSRVEQEKEIVQTEKTIDAIIGEKTAWFAPPSGSFSDETVGIAAEQGMETILWTVDTIDWKDPTVEEMLERVNKNIHPGALILMHPTKVVADGLEQMIQQINKQNLEIQTVHQLMDEHW